MLSVAAIIVWHGPLPSSIHLQRPSHQQKEHGEGGTGSRGKSARSPKGSVRSLRYFTSGEQRSSLRQNDPRQLPAHDAPRTFSGLSPPVPFGGAGVCEGNILRKSAVGGP